MLPAVVTTVAVALGRTSKGMEKAVGVAMRAVTHDADVLKEKGSESFGASSHFNLW